MTVPIPKSHHSPLGTDGDGFADLVSRAPAGLRTFFRIAEAWRLESEQQRTLLGLPPKSTFYKWRKGEVGGVTPDTMERLSHLFGIYSALHTLFTDAEGADGWLRRSNDAPLFGGAPALDRLLQGRVADLYDVRRYLDGVVQGGV